jgi:hypothetical protein
MVAIYYRFLLKYILSTHTRKSYNVWLDNLIIKQKLQNPQRTQHSYNKSLTCLTWHLSDRQGWSEQNTYEWTEQRATGRCSINYGNQREKTNNLIRVMHTLGNVANSYFCRFTKEVLLLIIKISFAILWIVWMISISWRVFIIVCGCTKGCNQLLRVG